MPARSRVGLEIDLPAAMRARLAMFDVAGRRVRTLLDRDLPAGSTAVMWDGRNASGTSVGSGLYFARLSWAGGERRAKVVLLK
jgi:flagellar hook assembly protein FlgD